MKYWLFSYCPIDQNIKFNIYFDNYPSNCFLSKTNKHKPNNNFINKVFCYMYNFENLKDLNYYYFRYTISNSNILINNQ